MRWHGAPAEQIGDAAGREVEATVLFADVADFTPLSESLPAYDVIHLLNRYFFHVGRAIEDADGQIDNYMGDGLMAVFRGDDASRNAVAATSISFSSIRPPGKLICPA